MNEQQLGEVACSMEKREIQQAASCIEKFEISRLSRLRPVAGALTALWWYLTCGLIVFGVITDGQSTSPINLLNCLYQGDRRARVLASIQGLLCVPPATFRRERHMCRLFLNQPQSKPRKNHFHFLQDLRETGTTLYSRSTCTHLSSPPLTNPASRSQHKSNTFTPCPPSTSSHLAFPLRGILNAALPTLALPITPSPSPPAPSTAPRVFRTSHTRTVPS